MVTGEASPIVVAKVGGSLLDWPGLPAALGSLLDEWAGRRVVLITGGGRAADFVRHLDGAHALGEEAAHALALRSLDLTAHALAAIVPGSVVVEVGGELSAAWSAGRVPILAPRRLLDADDGHPDAPEHTWRVTSDSIAARIAVRLGASELILLKSAPSSGSSREEAARIGLVDEAFPAAARPVGRVLYLNLRDPSARSVMLI